MDRSYRRDRPLRDPALDIPVKKKTELEADTHNMKFIKKFVRFVLLYKSLIRKNKSIFLLILLRLRDSSKVFAKNNLRTKLNTLLKYNFY